VCVKACALKCNMKNTSEVYNFIYIYYIHVCVCVYVHTVMCVEVCSRERCVDRYIGIEVCKSVKHPTPPPHTTPPLSLYIYIYIGGI
jgi:hypothetical protein